MTNTTQIHDEWRTGAGEILRQLGGNRFIAMTGAKDFVRNDAKRNIVFKIGRNASNVNYVRITLNSSDLYDIEFLNVRKFNVTTKGKADGIYAEDLQAIFTSYTGMDTRL